MKQRGRGGFGFLKVEELQWNGHPHFLINVHLKSKVTKNIFESSRMVPKREVANLYSNRC